MDCPTEEQLVRMALAELPELAELEFDLADRRLTVIHRDPAERVLTALEPLGFGAHVEASEPTAEPAPPTPGQAEGAAARERRVLLAVLSINAAMFVIELAAGLWAQSTGLVADSLDMLADASVYAIALLAVGGAHASQRRSARVSGWLQLALAGLVLVEVVRRATQGSEPISGAMMFVGLLALVANLTCVALLSRHRTGGVHLRASWIFTTNDALANAGVIAAGLLVAVTGSALPDLLIGTAIAVLVASGALRILRMSR
jgi:Co/Zn/Cd efflux system component